jgi:hypothetical protein
LRKNTERLLNPRLRFMPLAFLGRLPKRLETATKNTWTKVILYPVVKENIGRYALLLVGKP